MFGGGGGGGRCGTGGSESIWKGHVRDRNVGLRREEGPLGRDEGGHTRLTSGMEWGKRTPLLQIQEVDYTSKP